MRFVTFLFTILIFNLVYAQDKNEFEKGVKEKEVPDLALRELIEIIQPEAQVKWYYQEDGSKKVYEAKFIYNSKNFSVEFETNGKIYNVEIETELREFNPKLKAKLRKNLTSLFEVYEIRKIQIEYLGEADDLLDVISDHEIDDELKIQYEIEVHAKDSKNRGLYELMFDYKIELISKRKIKLKSTDIFDY